MKTSAIRKKNQGGFTLIELLVAIGIIGFMAGMITYALLGAQTDARVARTRGTIQKLNEIVLQQWEEYRYRPVDMRKGSFVSSNAAYPTPLPRTQSHLRTMILRDTMRMELPDRVTDLLFEPSQYVVPDDMPSSGPPQGPNQEGSFLAARAYPHRFATLYSTLYQAVISGNNADVNLVNARTNFPLIAPTTFTVAVVAPPATPPVALFSGTTTAGVQAWDLAVQSSELLYLIVATSNFGGSPALELFRPSEIGDPDGDGLLEFVDAWGRPIRWIRWPAGFPSDLNRYANTDAMDPLRTDWRFSSAAFSESNRPQTIVPLIVSGGTDEQFGVNFDFYDASNSPLTIYARMMAGSGLNQRYVDPFFVMVNGLPNGDTNATNLVPAANRVNQLGSISDSNVAADNVTNHDLILEP